ncbi:hypothetical protein ANO11243_027890 [Dothideomycetidae sp. 11243]|nr:hypothetical protein ANO11243_027890 [fungal sp. No.11243]
MPVDTYNLFQQVSLLKKTANMPILSKGDNESLRSALNTAVNNLFQNSLYNWSLAWGPQVWKFDQSNTSTPPDNAWYVAHANMTFPDGKQYDTYVVAIAGTAAKSDYDWKVEDFDVGDVVDFNAWVQGWNSNIQDPNNFKVQKGQIDLTKPYIALGTAIGVFQVLTNKSNTSPTKQGPSVFDFLSGLSGDNIRIIFTGHSLGGALSPTAALGMVQSGVLKAGNVIAYPSAGASPGEQNFANLFNKTFPQSTPNDYQTWNADFYNDRDIVPQAWSTDAKASPDRNLNNIFTIYPHLDKGAKDFVNNLLGPEQAAIQNTGITYMPIQGVAFQGPKPVVWVVTKDQLLIAVAKAHLGAYHDQIFGSNKMGSARPPAMGQVYRDFVDTPGVHRLNVVEFARLLPIFRRAQESDFSDEALDVYPLDFLLDQQ